MRNTNPESNYFSEEAQDQLATIDMVSLNETGKGCYEVALPYTATRIKVAQHDFFPWSMLQKDSVF